MDDVVQHLSWMAWTWQTGLFFVGIAACLATLMVLAIRRPETPRVGILQFATTRGDRFFVSLILAAFIYVFFIRFGGDNLLFPTGAAILVAILMFRFA